MYVPAHFEETDIAVLHALMRAHPLGTWVTQDRGEPAGELLINHIPFVLDDSAGGFGLLRGHVARANPVWRSLAERPSVVVFQGPQAYITPSWYAAKREHGKVVPTWNYAVVHAHGVPRAIEDRDWLLDLVSKLTDTHESHEAVPWKVTDAPPEYVDAMLRAIVGIEIPITRLEGKWKASQNRPAADREGTVEGLHSRGDDASLTMAALVGRAAGHKAGND